MFVLVAAGWGLAALAGLGLAVILLLRRKRAVLNRQVVMLAILAGTTLAASGELERIWEIARRPAMPAAQQQFVQAIDRWAEDYDRAANLAARQALRAARAAALCQMDMPAVTAWTGRVDRVTRVGDAIGLRLAMTHRITVSTAYGRRSEPLADGSHVTLIQPGTPLHAAASALRPDDAVRFSGVFQPSPLDCLREATFSMTQAMLTPEFMMRFTAIAPLARRR